MSIFCFEPFPTEEGPKAPKRARRALRARRASQPSAGARMMGV